jgi:hypothetical protein
VSVPAPRSASAAAPSRTRSRSGRRALSKAPPAAPPPIVPLEGDAPEGFAFLAHLDRRLRSDERGVARAEPHLTAERAQPRAPLEDHGQRGTPEPPAALEHGQEERVVAHDTRVGDDVQPVTRMHDRAGLKARLHRCKGEFAVRQKHVRN